MYKNSTEIPLSTAVWLAYDEYVKKSGISVTQLIKPIKAIVLANRVPSNSIKPDIASKFASRLGTAVHSSIEDAWHDNYKESLEDLGYPQTVIDSIIINPKYPIEKGQIPVYIEHSASKKINGKTISGTFDFSLDGQLEDFKTTSVYTYIKKTNDKNYKLQGSIYRWLNPSILTEDTVQITYIFKDWKALDLLKSKDYPPHVITPVMIPLMSIPETESWIVTKLNQINNYKDSDEDGIPPCTDIDLWMGQSTWKYYLNPTKTTRSTKNFNNPSEAYARKAEDGNKGLVKEVKTEAKACIYCDAVSICKQAENLVLNGKLKL